MIRRFRGELVHKVDQKGRVSVPATFRRALEEGDPDWHDGLNPNLVIVYGRPGKKFLECYSIKAMAELDEMIEDLPPFSEERDELERFLATKSVYAEVDPTGRIVLSQKLREQIGIVDEAVFAGTINTFITATRNEVIRFVRLLADIESRQKRLNEVRAKLVEPNWATEDVPTLALLDGNSIAYRAFFALCLT